ncbi:MAG: ATPase [Sphingomonadaceae bacterium]|nr:ATPase [Sphingomonadaceae bacterium]
MPQIDQLSQIYASQIFWLLVVFGIIYFVIGRGMMPKIEATVDARDHKIAEDLAAADRARKSAEATEADYTARIAEARAIAQKATAEAKSAAAAELEAKTKAADAATAEKLAAAEAQLEAARQAALGQIESVATEATQEIVQRLSGIVIDRDAAEAGARAALAKAA